MNFLTLWRSENSTGHDNIYPLKSFIFVLFFYNMSLPTVLLDTLCAISLLRLNKHMKDLIDNMSVLA